MIKIIFENAGGELDSRTVKKDSEVADAIAGMLGNLPVFYNGDTIRIECDDEDERK